MKRLSLLARKAFLSAFAGTFLTSITALPAYATTQFQNPDNCASCHPRQYQEWLGSSHAYAAVSPTFNALEVVGNMTSGGAFSAHSGTPTELFCQTCHTPVAVQMDKIKPVKQLPSYASDQRPTVDILKATTNAKYHDEAFQALLKIKDEGTQNDLFNAVFGHIDDAKTALRGNSCDVCHQAIGPEHTQQSQPFFYTPKDGFGGIANASFLFADLTEAGAKFGPFKDLVADGHDVCQAPEYGSGDDHCVSGTFEEKEGYISDANFCGSCHDVRPPAGPNSSHEDQEAGFLRLENLFTEWKESPWGPGTAPPPHFNTETTQAVSCQDCHMSTYPYGGVIGEHPLTKLYPVEKVSSIRGGPRKVSSHYFTGVDISLLDPSDFAEVTVDNETYDTQTTLARREYVTHTSKYVPNKLPREGSEMFFRNIFMPIGQHQRRVDLLQHAVNLDVTADTRWLDEGLLKFDVTLENIGAGHNVPAGFSQERQFWIGIDVRDANNQIVFRSGYLEGNLKELQKLAKIELTSDTLEITPESLQNAGINKTDAADVTYEEFEEYLLKGGKDKQLKFFGNEFKRRPSPTTKGVEVFSPFLANEMDNSHSLAPFAPETFTYLQDGLNKNTLAFPLKVTTTLNFRAFPPRFLQGLIDAMDAAGHPDLLPDDLQERNQVVEMARKEFTITGDSAGYTAMISAHGRCFDIPWNDYNNPNVAGGLHLWQCNSSANQNVRMKLNGQIEFQNGACVSVGSSDWNALDQANNINSNLRVGVEPCAVSGSDRARQTWQIHTNGRLKIHKQFAGEDQAREYCLERTNFSIGGAGQLTLASCWDSVRDSGHNARLTQQWFYQPSFRPIYNGSSEDGVERCLDIDSNAIFDNRAKIQLWACNGQLQQQWKISEKGLLINAAGQCVDVAGSDLHNLNEDGLINDGGPVRRAKVHAWNCHEGNDPSNIGPNERWKLEAGSLRTGFNNQGRYYCLGTTNGSTANGTEVTLYRCDNYHSTQGFNISDKAKFNTLLWSLTP